MRSQLGQGGAYRPSTTKTGCGVATAVWIKQTKYITKVVFLHTFLTKSLAIMQNLDSSS
jgi:hypothetical protein